MATVKSDKNSNKEMGKPEIIKEIRKARQMKEGMHNDETIVAIKEVERGKVKSYGSTKEMMTSLKKKGGV